MKPHTEFRTDQLPEGFERTAMDLGFGILSLRDDLYAAGESHILEGTQSDLEEIVKLISENT